MAVGRLAGRLAELVLLVVLVTAPPSGAAATDAPIEFGSDAAAPLLTHQTSEGAALELGEAGVSADWSVRPMVTWSAPVDLALIDVADEAGEPVSRCGLSAQEKLVLSPGGFATFKDSDGDGMWDGPRGPNVDDGASLATAVCESVSGTVDLADVG